MLLGIGDGGPKPVGTGRERNVVERFGERFPIGFVDLPGRERVDRRSRQRAEALRVEIVERNADDPAAGDKAGTREVEESGQELAATQITRRPDQDDDLRILRTDARSDLLESTHALMVVREANVAYRIM